MNESIVLMPYWIFEARTKRGELIYRAYTKNLTVDVGIHHLLDVGFRGATQNSAWYIGITEANPVANKNDTIASHSGWSEITAYSETTRPAWTTATPSVRKITNILAKSRFTINADGTVVGGSFLVSQNTKGGASGVLFAVVANPAGNQTLDIGQTVDILAAYTVA